MKMTVTCPCGCGHTFEVDVPERKLELTDEERARRSEHAKSLKSPGRPKGVVETKPRRTRSDKGKPRKGSLEKFMDLCGSFKTDPALCPFAICNGGQCDGVIIEDSGALRECTSMITCKHKYKKYELYTENKKDLP